MIPIVPESVFGATRETEKLPSHVTFVVNPSAVFSPQTHHPWLIEMDHEMGSLATYSLIPQKSANQYVAHYQVEARRPRLVGNFQFTDAWLTTHHECFLVGDAEVHLSQTFFLPERADDKLYFGHPPMHRMEIVVPGRFIEDRELWSVLGEVVPKEYEIRSLVQRLP